MTSDGGFRLIVVAFDGSTDSATAVQLAASVAAKYGARLIVAHVYNSPAMALAGGPGMPMPDYSELEAAAKDTGRSVLSRGVQLAAQAGVKAGGELIQASSVVEALVGFTSDQDADLLVVGTRGMTAFKKLVVGSVSSGLVSHAHCPVLVVR